MATRAIREGDWLLLDIWGKMKRPNSVYYDITWMGFVGSAPSGRMLEVFEIVRDARDAGVKTVVDLRWSEEIALNPSPIAKQAPQIRYVHASLLSATPAKWRELSRSCEKEMWKCVVLQQVRSELPSEAEPPGVEVQRADRPYASFYLSFSSKTRAILIQIISSYGL